MTKKALTPSATAASTVTMFATVVMMTFAFTATFMMMSHDNLLM
jgi:hypothetical protein